MSNISFFLTQQQIRDRTKIVTRRSGWSGIEPGAILNGVVKGQGLKRGEKVEYLCVIEVEQVRTEPLCTMSDDPDYGILECGFEGFPHLTPDEFVAMYCKHNGGQPDQDVTRILFRYRDDLPIPYTKENSMPKKATPTPETSAKPKRGRKPATPPPPASGKMDEAQVTDEKDQIGRAFANAGPAVERPGLPSDPAFDGDGAAEVPTEGNPVIPTVQTFAEPPHDGEDLQVSVRPIMFEYSEAQLAEIAKQRSALDRQIEEIESQKAEAVADFNSQIKGLKDSDAVLSKKVSARGEEREVEVTKRIDIEKGVATVFISEPGPRQWEILETRTLNDRERQVEMDLKKTGGRKVSGTWPSDVVVGATSKESPDQDAKNEAALQKLASEAAGD